MPKEKGEADQLTVGNLMISCDYAYEKDEYYCIAWNKSVFEQAEKDPEYKQWLKEHPDEDKIVGIRMGHDRFEIILPAPQGHSLPWFTNLTEDKPMRISRIWSERFPGV